MRGEDGRIANCGSLSMVMSYFGKGTQRYLGLDASHPQVWNHLSTTVMWI